VTSVNISAARRRQPDPPGDRAQVRPGVPAGGPAAGQEDRPRQPTVACRARKAAAFTRFWQVVEQNRRVPLREVST
jgi:hypothetical protein